MKISEFCALHKVTRQYVNQLIHKSVDNSFRFRGKYFFGKLDESGNWNIEAADEDSRPERKTHAEIKMELDEAKRDLTRDQIERNRAAIHIEATCNNMRVSGLANGHVRNAISSCKLGEEETRSIHEALDESLAIQIDALPAMIKGGVALDEEVARVQRKLAKGEKWEIHEIYNRVLDEVRKLSEIMKGEK